MLRLFKDRMDIMSNETFIRNLLYKYPNLVGLELKNNLLYYNNQSCNLNNINLANFFRQNVNLTKDLNILNSEEVFNIIACHCQNYEAPQYLLNLDENIIIKGLRVVNHQNKAGIFNKYLYLIDENDNTYLVKCDYAIDAFNYYEENINKNFQQITISMLNKYLSQFAQNSKVYEQDIGRLYQIKDYLLEPVKGQLDNYLKKIDEIELKADKTCEEIELLNQFKNQISEQKVQNNRQKYLRNRQIKAGYFNGFIIIGLVSLLGIILSLLLVKG